MIVIPGPASKELGEKIAAELGAFSHPVENKVFPDGEQYVRFTAPLKGETVVIVQTTSPPQDSKLIQLYMMTSTAKELGARRIICVVPYLAYARQDKRFLDGEVVSLDIVLRLLESSGADDLIVVDAHSAESLQRIRSRVEIWNLSAIPILARHLREQGYGGAYSLGPDRGALHLAESAANELSGGFGFFEKQRDRKTGEIEMQVRDLNVRGRDAVVFDDIISSGGTMALAVSWLKRLGARRVAAACTHALFIGDAEKRILGAGAGLIVAADTVQTKFSEVSVSKLIADHLRTI